ncbi:MAG: hydroxyacylglutathione hydrolase [Magnetococcales bacterium]|nr:hydroxyacylglutathione hydrolase [Magnetococcales bacterium]
MNQPSPSVEPVLAGRDNFIWMIATAADRYAAVDPGEADPVSRFLSQRQATLSHILITHHHGDHIGGVETLKARHGGEVIGGAGDAARLPPLDHPLSEGMVVRLNDSLAAELLEVPGHTLGHVAYRIGDALFSGDTLFGFGCGRLFEGTPAMMWQSLLKLRNLPDATRLFPGHEYTLANLDFLVELLPGLPELSTLRQEFVTLLDARGATVPHPLAVQKRFNPFFKADDPEWAALLGLAGLDPVARFAWIRERRNRY